MVIGPAIRVQSVSPAPVNHPHYPQIFAGIPGLTGTSGMADLFKAHLSDNHLADNTGNG